MTKEEVNYLTAKDLPSFLGSEIWVQKKTAMISKGSEIVLFGKAFIELTLLDVDFNRNQLVLQGQEGRVEVIALSECALILSCSKTGPSVSTDDQTLVRGDVRLDQ